MYPNSTSKIDLIKLVRHFDPKISLVVAKAIVDSFEIRYCSTSFESFLQMIKFADVVGKVSRGEIVYQNEKFYPSLPAPIEYLWD